MNRFLLLIVFLVSAKLSWGQTPAGLVRDVRENTSSVNQLINILQKQYVFRDFQAFSQYNRWDTLGFLGHKKFLECYRYKILRPNGDTANKLLYLTIVYKDDRVGYVKIREDYFDCDSNRSCENDIFKYIDSAYATRALAGYNSEHNTEFTWRDLYEDNLYYFGGLPGLYEKPKPLTPQEIEKGILRDDTAKANTTKEYEPLLVNRDHKTIIKHCKSFNPARKAYGAYCLYLLKQEGITLSEEEDELFWKISHSNEKTELHAGCLGYRNIKLSSFLCREHLDPTRDERQTPFDLEYAVKMNLGSASALLSAIKKLADEKKQKGDWATYDAAPGLLDHKRILQRFNYSRRDWQVDSIVHSYVMVEAVYKDDKVRYVRLVECCNNDEPGPPQTRELFRYADAAYAKRILLPYNKKHGTHLTDKDLYDEGFKIQTSPL